MGTWTNRGTRVHVWWQFAASRPAIFHRGKSGEMVQKGSNHPRFGRAIRAHPHCCPSLYLFPSTSPFLRILSRAQVFIRPYTRHYFPPFFPLDSSHDHPQIYISSGEEASSASVYRAHGRGAVVSTRYDLLLYASIRTFVT